MHHLDPCRLAAEEHGDDEEEAEDDEDESMALGHARLCALRRWLAHLVAKLPLRFHAYSPRRLLLLGRPLPTSTATAVAAAAAGRGGGGGSVGGAYVRLVARFLAHYGPTPAVCAAIVMRGGAPGGTQAGGTTGYTLPDRRDRSKKGGEAEGASSSSSYAPVFCMTAAEALMTGGSSSSSGGGGGNGGPAAAPAPAAATSTAAASSSSLAAMDASQHSTGSHNYHLHRQQPVSITGGGSSVSASASALASALDVSQRGGDGGGGAFQQQRGQGQQQQQHHAAGGGGGCGGGGAPAAAAMGAPPGYWADFWRSGIEPALQGLPEGGDRYLLLPKGEDEAEEADGEEDPADARPRASNASSPSTTSGGAGSGLRSLLLPPGLFRRLSSDDASFWARARSPGRGARAGGGKGSGGGTPERRGRRRRPRRTIVDLPQLPEAEAAAALAGTFVHQSGARWRAGSAHVAQPQFAYYVAPVSGSEALVVLFADRSRPAADRHVMAFVRAMVAVLADRAVFAVASP